MSDNQIDALLLQYVTASDSSLRSVSVEEISMRLVALLEMGHIVLRSGVRRDSPDYFDLRAHWYFRSPSGDSRLAELLAAPS